MIITALSDLHGDISRRPEIAADLSGADIVLLTGDLTHFGHHTAAGLAVGAVRAFIEETKPLIRFTGHIHEGRGIDALGPTRIVNPGPLGYGGHAYAVVSRTVETLEIRGKTGQSASETPA